MAFSEGDDMERLIGLGIAVLMLIPATAQASWEMPAPVVSPGDYKAKTYTTDFDPGNVDYDLEAYTSNNVVYSVQTDGRTLFTHTFDSPSDEFTKPLYPGTYTAQAVWTVTFKESVVLDVLNGSVAYPSGFECTTTETSRVSVNYSDGQLSHYRVSGSVTCTESLTGRTYHAAVTDFYLDADESFTPEQLEESTSTYLTLTTPATWSQTQTKTFTVKAINGSTVSYDEYALIKKGMKRAKVERIFGNSSGVFYRKVKKGKLFIYDSNVYITYKNNKVTNTRYTF